MKGWVKTKVGKRGKLSIPQGCGVPIIGGFIFERVELANEAMNEVSQKQKDKITKTAKQNPQRVLGSKTLEAIIADRITSNK
ncbi:MAG TPA: hypothetical protein DDW65_19025 [Firmicutes bacterium]|jgi:hypothetical protein|nr:hypothetical protein [Bacillota bacterium]